MKKRFYIFICLVVPVIITVVANRDFFIKSMNQRFEDEIFDKVTSDSTEWFMASGSYYDPMDSTQTKSVPDGIGAIDKISKGSIALDRKSFAELKNQGASFLKVRIIYKYEVDGKPQFKVFSSKTPYGWNIYKVDDLLGQASKQLEGKRRIDFPIPHTNLPFILLYQGRFWLEYSIVKIEKGIADNITAIPFIFYNAKKLSTQGEIPGIYKILRLF